MAVLWISSVPFLCPFQSKEGPWRALNTITSAKVKETKAREMRAALVLETGCTLSFLMPPPISTTTSGLWVLANNLPFGFDLRKGGPALQGSGCLLSVSFPSLPLWAHSLGGGQRAFYPITETPESAIHNSRRLETLKKSCSRVGRKTK